MLLWQTATGKQLYFSCWPAGEAEERNLNLFNQTTHPSDFFFKLILQFFCVMLPIQVRNSDFHLQQAVDVLNKFNVIWIQTQMKELEEEEKYDALNKFFPRPIAKSDDKQSTSELRKRIKQMQNGVRNKQSPEVQPEL
jgi:hypothetical protein